MRKSFPAPTQSSLESYTPVRDTYTQQKSQYKHRLVTPLVVHIAPYYQSPVSLSLIKENDGLK